MRDSPIVEEEEEVEKDAVPMISGQLLIYDLDEEKPSANLDQRRDESQ